MHRRFELASPGATDLRSVPDRVLRLYLWPYGAWGIGLLFLFAAGQALFAVTLCFPLALWLGALTLWWGRDVLGRLRVGELSRPEVDAGVRSIGRILASGAATPGIVFLAHEPFSPTTWGTCASVAIVVGIAWASATYLTTLSNRWSNVLALVAAWMALPLNATGALSLGFWFGWFDVVMATTSQLP